MATREKGVESVKINYKENNKNRFNDGEIISTCVAFLKSLIITKGKIMRCLDKFNTDKSKVIRTYSNN